MPWPADDLSTADVDSGADKPPRAEFFKLFQRVKAVIAGRGTAEGIASLDARRRVPDAELGRGIAAGVAALDGQGRVPQAQLPPQPVPVLWKPGDLKVHAGPVVEDGWLPADGGESSRIEDAALFAAIGTRWGEGDGATTFKRPDYSDAFILGASATRPVGTTGGEEKHTLTVERDTGARTWCRARESARRRSHRVREPAGQSWTDWQNRQDRRRRGPQQHAPLRRRPRRHQAVRGRAPCPAPPASPPRAARAVARGR